MIAQEAADNNRLVLDLSVLDAVIAGSGTERAGSKRRAGNQVVSAAVLAELTQPTCRCADVKTMAGLGLPVLIAGMPTRDLVELGAGCTTRISYVCPTLDNLRRRHGL